MCPLLTTMYIIIYAYIRKTNSVFRPPKPKHAKQVVFILSPQYRATLLNKFEPQFLNSSLRAS